MHKVQPNPASDYRYMIKAIHVVTTPQASRFARNGLCGIQPPKPGGVGESVYPRFEKQGITSSPTPPRFPRFRHHKGLALT